MKYILGHIIALFLAISGVANAQVALKMQEVGLFGNYRQLIALTDNGEVYLGSPRTRAAWSNIAKRIAHGSISRTTENNIHTVLFGLGLGAVLTYGEPSIGQKVSGSIAKRIGIAFTPSAKTSTKNSLVGQMLAKALKGFSITDTINKNAEAVVFTVGMLWCLPVLATAVFRNTMNLFNARPDIEENELSYVIDALIKYPGSILPLSSSLDEHEVVVVISEHA